MCRLPKGLDTRNLNTGIDCLTVYRRVGRQITLDRESMKEVFSFDAERHVVSNDADL